jgi:ubiquinone/menaquinone biosynthesis C-methylase UbiE
LSKYEEDPGERRALARGMKQRLDYRPLPDAADDRRFPWFLYWEIYWVLRRVGPFLHPGMRLLDAGGASSLFTCYLASLGHELHSVDLNQRLLENGHRVASTMGWPAMFSYAMDMGALRFPDAYFDHAFSICVFEHLDYDVKQAALSEIARCLKPSGLLALTFDYRNPAPGVVGVGKDPRPRNSLKSESDLHRSFLSSGRFRVMGNPLFHDNAKSYLQHPRYHHEPYTFGAIFLQRR